MRKLILFMFFISISCENDPLLDGMFSSDLFNGNYILNLKFLNSNKAILIFPNNLSCNKYSFDQIELDVEKIDNNAIKLNFTNKDFKHSDIIDLLSFCNGELPLIQKVKWEESEGTKNGFANLKLGESIDNTPNEEILSNPLNYNLIPNSIYIMERKLVYNLWLVFYNSGYNGNMDEFFELINTNSNAVNDLYDLAIKQKKLTKYLDDKNEFIKYYNLSIKEFKTLLDIGYANLINEEYINAIRSTKEIDYVKRKLIDKLLIVNNLEKEITIGEGNKVFFKRLKTK
jgi:hypothetical protein